MADRKYTERNVWRARPKYPEGTPNCQRNPSRGKDLKKKCQAAMLDNTEKRVLIVYEKSFPEHLRRWGFPKGKFKEGEQAGDCVHREVCEEVGIEIDKYPHIYRKRGKDHIIVFSKPAEEIELYLGPEILDARWVDLEWLRQDVIQDSINADKHPKGEYNYKYNRDIRELVPKIK